MVADLEMKYCRLASEFGMVCEKRRVRVNVFKIEIMNCLREDAEMDNSWRKKTIPFTWAHTWRREKKGRLR